MNTRHYFDHVLALYVPMAAAVFCVVTGLLVFGIIHYRAGRGHEPSKRQDFKLAERTYAAVLACLAAFLAVYAAVANADERAPLDPPRLDVTITGYQWCWSFHYAKTPVTIRSTCVHNVPTLVVPTGETIKFSLTSEDVVHEWWLPYARWKEEAFPGHTSTFELRFSSAGTWQGRCSEFCGLYHDRMDFAVRAESPSKFKAWLTAESAHTGGGT